MIRFLLQKVCSDSYVKNGLEESLLDTASSVIQVMKNDDSNQVRETFKRKSRWDMETDWVREGSDKGKGSKRLYPIPGS